MIGMVLSEATEAAFHAAIEAAYALHDEAASSEEREAAARQYDQEKREYLRLSSEQWWERECEDFPDCQQCKDYDC